MLIHKFIFDCNVEEIEKIIDKFKLNEDMLKKIVNLTDHRGNKPIFLCILLRSIYKNEDQINKLLRIMKVLIENGAMIRVRNSDNRTPLEEATSNVN